MFATRKHVAVTLPVVVVLTTACASVQPVQDPSRFIAEANPAVVYVTHSNRAQLAIEAPRVSGDTLMGTWQGRDGPIAIPLSQVTAMSARQHDRRRTTFFAIGVATVTLVGIYAIIEANSGEELVCDYDPWPPKCEGVVN